jgi:hypothetical protein
MRTANRFSEGEPKKNMTPEELLACLVKRELSRAPHRHNRYVQYLTASYPNDLRPLASGNIRSISAGAKVLFANS